VKASKHFFSAFQAAPVLGLFLSSVAVKALNAAEPPSGAASDAFASATQLTLEPAHSGLWQGGVGDGFRSTAQSLSLEAGASAGFAALGGRLAHDLALVSLSYGHILGPVRGDGHWYRGNWELRGELFTGAEFSPGSTWGIGLTPHLRYDFATGTRWVPFADIGAGVTATGERAPDLGGAFEFNLQAGTGIHWFVRDNLAVTVEARYLHVSSAGLYHPNLGLNTVAGLVGVTWFF
jgi:lipid A 3-O-deacylase